MYKKSQSFLLDQTNGEQMYLLALTIFLLSESLGTTMFSVPGSVYLLSKMLALGILGLKMALYGRYRITKLCFIVGMLLEVVMVYSSSTYQDPLMWMAFAVAASAVDFEKILKVYVVVTFTVLMAAVLASGLGVIPNLQYQSEEGRGIRNSFGSAYPTDFAAHIFFLMITVLYLSRRKFCWCYSFVCLVVAGMVYCFCNTRLDSICMILAALGYAVLYWHQRSPKLLKRKYQPVDSISRYGIYSMPVAAIIMFLLSGFYTSENKILDMLNNWMSNRLSLGKRGLTEYPVTLFGQWVYMLGNGRTEKLPSAGKYFFIDCSYLYVFMRYGLIFLLIVLTVYVICCKKYRMNQYFVFTIALIALNCMIAHHLIDLAYNPFALALLADDNSFPLYKRKRGT